MKEARRRRRRRWARRLLVSAVGVGIAAGVAVLATASGRSPGRAATATSGVLPTGPFATLHLAGPLAVAPDGALYVTDVVGPSFELRGDRILVRMPGGRFRVVAGDGTVGFTGDGGPAVRAELSRVSDLVLAPNGALYIADGGHVRMVGRDGVIRTIAGNGRPLQPVANGAPALSASLGSTATTRPGGFGSDPLSIALSPRTGQLYISTGRQILQLTSAGRLDTVRAILRSGFYKGRLSGFGPIAIDEHGDIDVSGGPYGWAIYQVTANGIAHAVAGLARGSGGTLPVLKPGPGGAIYAGRPPGIARVSTRKLVPVSALTTPISANNERGGLRGQYFPLTDFVFSPNGTVYADDLPGAISGFEEHQQLLSISNGHVNLLWQENNRTSR